MQNISIESFQIIGIAIRTSNQDNKALGDIGALWQRFLNESLAEQIPNKLGNEVYSLYTEYEGDHNKPYTAMLGCKVSSLENIPEGMVGKSISGGNYVKMSARGNLMEGLIAQQWGKIWEMPIQRAYTSDFEVFGDKAQNPSDAEVDFLVALK